MGYFDGLADGAFKKDTQGRHVFYPWGILGAGYIIPAEEEKQKIRTFYKRMFVVMLPLIIINQILIGFVGNLIVLPIYYVWFYLKVKKIAATHERSTEKLKASESYKNSAKSHNWPTLIILILVSIGFVGLGIAALIQGETIIGSILVVMFGTCGAVITYMARVKAKK